MKCRSECTACRSRYMTSEEIARERKESGWNPYWSEEETTDTTAQKGAEWNREKEEQQEIWSPLIGNDPALEQQRLAERDLRQLQSMYPAAAKIMLPYIEEICDKMEYEGSCMYDQYPDRMTVYRLSEEIFEKVKDEFPEQRTVEKDEVLAMQYHAPKPEKTPDTSYPPKPSGQEFPEVPVLYGYNQPGVNWVRDLAQVLLLNEMHHRRRRKKNLFI